MTSNLVMTHQNYDDSNYKSDTISYISLAKQIGMIDYLQIIVIVVEWLRDLQIYLLSCLINTRIIISLSFFLFNTLFNSLSLSVFFSFSLSLSVSLSVSLSLFFSFSLYLSLFHFFYSGRVVDDEELIVNPLQRILDPDSKVPLDFYFMAQPKVLYLLRYHVSSFLYFIVIW